MLSSSLYHYPRITFKEDEKKLWNPILKKAFKHLPEERVRLKLVEYLIEEAGFSKNRISFESPVDLPKDKSRSRTDLICYDQDFKPLLLVECKAPEVQLDEKVAQQISRYNTEVGAPLLLVTNGLKDFWFRSEDDSLKYLDQVPEPFQSSSELSYDFGYWVDRGFVGDKSHPEIRKWVTESCSKLYIESTNPARFLSFDGSANELGLPNYYQIILQDNDHRLALALTSTPFGATRLNVILNKEGQNVALLSASLDLLASEEEKNTFLQNADGMKQLDLKTEIGFNLYDNLLTYTADLTELMTE